MKQRAIIVLIYLAIGQIVSAQDSTVKKSPFTFSAYADVYAGIDFTKPANQNRPSFIYNFNRDREFTVNLAYAKIAYDGGRVRANLALSAGTYMNANYAAEPATLQHLLEANIGVKLSKQKDLWLDLGIMPSHIGFESAVGKDNWTLTRSLLAENSPYFESGAKLSYGSDNGKWNLAVLALNGWQRITRVPGNTLLSGGAQLSFKPTAKVTLNYSNFIGTDKPDSNRLIRTYHNFYGIFQMNAQWGLTAGFDIGTEQKPAGQSGNSNWYSPVMILRYTPSAQWAFAARGEYFSDPDQVIIGTGTPNGFRTFGASVNADWWVIPNAVLRVEYRWLQSKDAIFVKNNVPQQGNQGLTFTAAVSF